MTPVTELAGLRVAHHRRVVLDVPHLAVSPGVDIKGQIASEDGKTPTNFKFSNVRVMLTPTDDVPVGNAQAQVQADGTFKAVSRPQRCPSSALCRVLPAARAWRRVARLTHRRP